MCRLIDKHGLDAIRHKFTKHSPAYKLAAINRVLEDGEPIKSVAVDIGLTNDSILQQWIKSYIENGYNVVTKKKGRPSTRDKGKEDNRGAGEGERGTSRATVEEDYRGRIIKKTSSLSSRGRKEEKEQLTKAVTELRQELKFSLYFIL
jgi:transposase-like protein